MSPHLKDSLEREASRLSPSPAPIGAIVESGRATVRRRRIVAVTLTAVVAVIAVGLPVLATHRNDNAPAGHGNGLGWSDLHLAYGDSQGLHWGSSTIARPRGLVGVLPSGSSLMLESTVGGHLPALQVLHGTSTLTPLGRSLGAAAEDSGSLVAWTRPSGPHRVALVAYDTSTQRRIARLRFLEAPHSNSDRLVHVVSVSGGIVYFTRGKQSFAWTPGHGARPTPLPQFARGLLVDVRGGVAEVYHRGRPTRFLDVAGRSVSTSRKAIIGQLSPDGAYVLGYQLSHISSNGNVLQLWRVSDGQVVPLRGYQGVVGLGEWDRSGALVIASVASKNPSLSSPITYFGCQPASGQCQALPAPGATLGSSLVINLSLLDDEALGASSSTGSGSSSGSGVASSSASAPASAGG